MLCFGSSRLLENPLLRTVSKYKMEGLFSCVARVQMSRTQQQQQLVNLIRESRENMRGSPDELASNLGVTMY